MPSARAVSLSYVCTNVQYETPLGIFSSMSDMLENSTEVVSGSKVPATVGLLAKETCVV